MLEVHIDSLMFSLECVMLRQYETNMNFIKHKFHTEVCLKKFM